MIISSAFFTVPLTALIDHQHNSSLNFNVFTNPPFLINKQGIIFKTMSV